MPDSLEGMERLAFVSVLVTVTTACAISAPLPSLTSPAMPPRLCPKTSGDNRIAHTIPHTENRFTIVIPSSKPG
jgi:hypothetical protein